MVQYLVGARDVSLFQSIHIGSGAHGTSCQVGTRISLLWVKWLEHDVDYLPPSSAEVKNAWSYTSTPWYGACLSMRTTLPFHLLFPQTALTDQSF
jgi:hypothetical protein